MSLLATDLPRAHRFLKAKSSAFPKQTQADFAANKVRFADSDINHTADVSEAGGIFDLLRSTNDKEVGISDFDGNKLEAGTNAAIDKIRFAYGKAAKTSNPKATDVAYSTLRNSFPKALLSAKLIIKQDGKTLLKLPVERFTQGASSQKVQGEEDALNLGTPIVLIEQKQIDIQLEFGPNSNMDAEDNVHFCQVRLMGTETMAR